MESIHNWLGPDAWPLVRAGLLQLGGALLILVFGLVLARWLGGLLHRVMRSANVESMLADFLRTLTRSVFSVLAVVAALDAADAPGRAYHVIDPVFQHARDFFFALSEALDLPRPRDGAPFAIAWPIARVRGQGAVDLLQRGKSTLFDFSQACGKLSYDPKVSLEDGLAALAAWVEAQGGAKAVAAMRKPPPGASVVDAQVAAAGGD